MSAPIAFVDCETTGLDPVRHPIWEIAIIVDDVEHCWQVEVTGNHLENADTVALDMNGFRTRYRSEAALSKQASARKIEELLAGRHIVGAVPSFDEERLRRLTNCALRGGLPPEGGRYPWHYHLIDVEAMAVGYLAGLGTAPPTSLPWKSHDLSAALGVVEPVEDEHTALGDARWAKRLYERMTEPPTWNFPDWNRTWSKPLVPAPLAEGQRYRMLITPALDVVPCYLTIGTPGVDLTVYAKVSYQDEPPTSNVRLHLADVVAAIGQGWLVPVEGEVGT